LIKPVISEQTLDTSSEPGLLEACFHFRCSEMDIYAGQNIS